MGYIEEPSHLPEILGVSKNRFANAVKEGAEYAGISGGGGGAVSSVNGATGDVILRAISIPEDNSTNVQSALNHASAERASLQAGVAAAHSDIEALETVVADNISKISHNTEILHRLTTLTVLDVAEYGDFNDAKWLELEDGGYYLEASGSALSNAPFSIDHPAYVYSCEFSILNGEAHYLHKLSVVVTGQQRSPQVYQRGGQSDLSELLLRGWSRLDNMPYDVASYLVVVGRAFNAGEVDLASGSSLTLTTLLHSGTTTSYATSLTGRDATPPVFATTPLGYRVPYIDHKPLQNIKLQFRIDGTVSGSSTAVKTLRLALRRQRDDTTIAHINLTKDDDSSLDSLTGVLNTWVYGEADTLITEGWYVDLANDSGRTWHITGLQMLIQVG